ncbi:PREDICTED: facilitated trehalose transporter Tret1-like [Ceratosolen solmsi marchali]|uniref:Facilitated trehalose transporter Tret1-like n=1 Tax=Ceratosolen solmsi marchali TaxID=326594 RepID=A0AAJ6YLQ1_9HYME|nr:PREDICTED: facilitated trehalose transporter Tret1-like [Ceratosolen solmsi marchali]
MQKASTVGFAVGVTLGWNSLAGLALSSAIGWDSVDVSDVICIVSAGAAVGSLLIPAVLSNTKKLPRRFKKGANGPLVFAAVPLLILGWILIYLADYSYRMLMVGRVVSGLGIGSACVLVPLYIGEISSNDARDTLLAYFHAMLTGGIFCAYAIAASRSYGDDVDVLPLSRYSLCCALACLPGLLCCAAPPSPYQLMMATPDGGEEAAREALQRLDSSRLVGQAGKEALDREIERMRTLAVPRVNRPLEASLVRGFCFLFLFFFYFVGFFIYRLGLFSLAKLKVLRNKRFWGVFSTVTCIMACQQLSGVSPIIFNALMLFDLAGSNRLLSSQLSLIFGSIQIIFSILVPLLVKRLGRRKLLSMSSTIMGCTLLLLGSYIKGKDTVFESNNMNSWILPMSSIAVFITFYNIGIGPISWSLLADSFPFEVKYLTASIIVGIGWSLCYVLNFYITTLMMNLGVTETLWLFIVFSILNTIISQIFLIESRGKTLTDIQDEFVID